MGPNNERNHGHNRCTQRCIPHAQQYKKRDKVGQDSHNRADQEIVMGAWIAFTQTLMALMMHAPLIL